MGQTICRRVLGRSERITKSCAIDCGRCRLHLYLVKRLMRDQLRSRLARNAGWMFLGQGVSFAVQACYFVLLARLLGADQYGIFVGAAAAVSLLSQYSTLGSGLVL